MGKRASCVGTPLDFSKYAEYVCSVEGLARDALAGRLDDVHTRAALDGAPSRELRRVVPLRTRRAAGAFFTTSGLRDGAFRDALPKTPSSFSVLDPACGAGDLLVRWSDRLAVAGTLEQTLRAWERHIQGRDLQAEFVRLTRARLVLAAASRVRAVARKRPLESCFPRVAVGDGLMQLNESSIPHWTLMNPPFGLAPAPEWFDCGSGLVSQSAAFVAAWIHNAVSGQRMVALLPEVLRTGSRYRAWRDDVASNASILKVVGLGQFDSDVDIDVFLLSLRATATRRSMFRWWDLPPVEGAKTLKSSPSVAVGTVVPHRDDEVGPARRFLTANNLPHVREVPTPTAKRKYRGRVFQPPFVAVRRTSRPGQRPRALATVVAGTDPVAVENHLIVVEPIAGGLAECRRIAAVLEAARSSEWLDQRLGGRHLTTIALAEMLRGAET